MTQQEIEVFTPTGTLHTSSTSRALYTMSTYPAQQLAPLLRNNSGGICVKNMFCIFSASMMQQCSSEGIIYSSRMQQKGARCPGTYSEWQAGLLGGLRDKTIVLLSLFHALSLLSLKNLQQHFFCESSGKCFLISYCIY